MDCNQIICFQQDTVERKRFFKAGSFAHPAKMILGLQIYLIEHYTKPGDVILDPMAGSGTILIACTLGRNVVCVELEEKFIKMIEGNWEKIKRLGPMLGFTMGEATILQGDARDLQGLLVDKIVTSPPYAEAEGQLSADKVANPEKFAEISSERFKQGKKKGHFATKEAILRSMEKRQKGCGENPNNISKLPYGKADAVISSPPYAGMDIEFQVTGTAHQVVRKKGEKTLRYQADAVITSPPYEEGGGHGGKPTKVAIEKRQSSMGQGTENLYSSNSENIGNLKSDNYLEAMLQVYRQCHRVLKDGGLLCLVVKNFIREKKIVRLDLDTIKLCENAGFVLKERLKRKLTQQSFWRTIYYKKFPEVEKIEYEDVLIFTKSKGK